ncbi:MAG: hypothetical protein D6730_03475 [Bacteroidetes bacterium]|nr:MAG: hypothetical protein D6730_03475 [Bacteroidota bacterium]
MAQTPAKEDQKAWQSRAKKYTKDPLSLKAEIQAYKDSINYWKQANKRLELSGSGGDMAYWEEVDSLQQVIVRLENELRQLIRQNAQLEKASMARQQVTDLGIKSGLVYRIQFADASPSKQAARNFNDYVVGNFRTEEQAKQFQQELKSLGMKKETTIVPYIDGVRVEMSEAKDYERIQGIK